MFNAKFFCGEAKFAIAKLGQTTQYLGEDLDVYVKMIREGALDCSDAVEEETLVDSTYTTSSANIGSTTKI